MYEAISIIYGHIPSGASMRSRASGFMVIPPVRSATAQSMSFVYVGPPDWYCLLQSLHAPGITIPLNSLVPEQPFYF